MLKDSHSFTATEFPVPKFRILERLYDKKKRDFEFVKGVFSKQKSNCSNHYFMKTSQKWIRIGEIVTCHSQNEIMNPDLLFLIIQRFQSFILRLNSGIFRILELSEWNSNLNSSNCRAPKIICSNTILEPISWEMNSKNPLFDFCVGVWVGGHSLANLKKGFYISKWPS